MTMKAEAARRYFNKEVCFFQIGFGPKEVKHFSIWWKGLLVAPTYDQLWEKFWDKVKEAK